MKTRGYITVVQNSRYDYLRMAYALALSLRNSQSEVKKLSILIERGMEVPWRYREVFDRVIELRGDLSGNAAWKVHNKWEIYDLTPYDETVLLDADMLFLNDVSIWWAHMERFDFLACSDVLTYRGELVTSDYYRKAFSANALPNVYSAFLYFKKSKLAADVWYQTREIIEQWPEFVEQFLPRYTPEQVSSDVAIALAIKLMDCVERCVHPGFGIPTFIHMKTQLQNWMLPMSEIWTRHVTSCGTDGVRIGNHRVHGVLHYQDKNFLTPAIVAALETTNAG